MSKRDVVFAVPTPPPFSGPEVNSKLLLDRGLGHGLRTHHVRTNVGSGNTTKGRVRVGALLALFRWWLRLVGLLIVRRPGVVYFCLSQNRTGFARDAVIVLTSWLAGARPVAHVRGGNFSNFRSHASPTLRRTIDFVVRRCCRVIVLGERFRPPFEDLVSPERVHVVYNAVDTDLLGGPADMTARLRTDGPVYAYVGHLSVAKGLGDVLSAIPTVLAQLPTARFVFAGEWLEREGNILFDQAGRPLPSPARGLRERWRELQARYPGHLEHLGTLDRHGLASTLLSSDVFVLPSYSEGLPTSVLEAMAAGLPVVVTPVGSLPEFLRDGENGIIVQIGEPESLGRALVALGSDPERRRAIGERNRDLIRQRFSVPQHVESIARIVLACCG